MRLEKLLEEMENACDSQALAVADCLRTIAENGDEQSEPEYLAGCAREIADWALYAAKKLDPKKKGA